MQKNSIVSIINISDEAIKYIENSDIAVLFGNIFDNAIEAAEKSNEKIIILDVRLQGIYMENSYNETCSSIELNTTKPNRNLHGIGIKNVKKIVEKYDGMMEYSKNEDGMFCCDILLKKSD